MTAARVRPRIRFIVKYVAPSDRVPRSYTGTMPEVLELPLDEGLRARTAARSRK